MTLRRKLVPIHRWVGLTIGLIALLSASTGALMAFRAELDPIAYPGNFVASHCAQHLPADWFAEAARRLHPQARLDYLRFRFETGTPVAARFTDKDTLYFDPCTGGLTADQNRYQGFFGTLEWIHRGQWLPRWLGDKVMGAGALAVLFLLVGIGLYLWWPRKPRRLSQGFVFNPKLKGPALDIGLHRAVGAWIALPLLLSAITALPNAFPTIYDGLTAIGRAAPPHYRSGPAVPLPKRLPLETAWATANRLSPSPREILMHVGLKPSDPIEIYIIAANAPHPNARTYLYLDAYSGRIISYLPYKDMNIGSKIYFWMLSLHTGQVGGIFGQLFIFFGAIGLIVMAYSGYSSYFRKEALKRKKSKSKAALPKPNSPRASRST